jgi:trk system potassium uptake protein TrkA
MRIIIVGAGGTGFNIGKRLVLENHEIVFIEQNEEVAKSLEETMDVQVITGNGSNPDVLTRAGINEANILIACTDQDEINMISSLFAGHLNKNLIKIIRIRDKEYMKVHDAFGTNGLNVNLVINPEKVTAENIIKLLNIPGTSNVIDFAEGKVKLVGIKIDKSSELIGKKLLDLKSILLASKILIAIIKRNQNIIIPKGTDIISENDEIFFISEPLRILKIMQLFGKSEEPISKIMIIGGSQTGHYIAEGLETKDRTVKLIEKNHEKCVQLASSLSNTIVLHGDGTDIDLLKNENISEMDAFITVTGEDDKNILASLQAKKMGVKKVITLMNKIEYMHLASQIGVDIVVCPRVVAISNILQFVRRGIVLSVTELSDESAEAIEVIAQKNTKLVGKPISKIDLPKGSLLGAIERSGEIIIPTGEDKIVPGDRLFIIALKGAIKNIEEIL